MLWQQLMKPKKTLRTYKVRTLNIRFLIVNILAVVFLGFSLYACGKKGPPVPPEQKIPFSVNDLNKHISENNLTLSWTIDDKKDNQFEAPSGFIVYKAKDTINHSFCSGCPLRFMQVSDISLKNHGTKKTIAYVESLVKGCRYAYKVRAYTNNKIFGKDSNIIEFTY